MIDIQPDKIEFDYRLTLRERIWNDFLLLAKVVPWLGALIALAGTLYAVLFLMALALLIFAFYVWLRPSGPAIDLGPGIDMSVQTLAAMAIVAALFVGYWSLTRHIRLSIDENGITKRSLPPISGARKPRRRIAWSRVLPIAEDASNLYIRSRPSWIGRKFHVTVPKRLFARPDEMERFVQAIEAWREADQTPAGTPDSWPPAPQARK